MIVLRWSQQHYTHLECVVLVVVQLIIKYTSDICILSEWWGRLEEKLNDTFCVSSQLHKHNINTQDKEDGTKYILCVWLCVIVCDIRYSHTGIIGCHQCRSMYYYYLSKHARAHI